MNKKDLAKWEHDLPFAPMSDLIYEYLKEEIINIRLLPNEKIKESQIATELGISRTPVKNALDRLINEGLLVKEGHKTPFVAEANLKDCLDICYARMSIEGDAAFYAAKNASQKQLEVIQYLGKNYKKSLLEGEDPMKAAQIDSKFHAEIVNASGNPYLIEMHSCIRVRCLRNRCFVQYLIGPAGSAEELIRRSRCHDALMHALNHGLSRTAKDEIRQDINGMVEMYVLR